MKVPHSVVGRTREPQQGLAYFDGSGAQRGIASIEVIGKGLLAADEEFQKRALQTKKFAAMRSMSEFETNTDMVLQEAKRNSAADDANFLSRMTATYDDNARHFLSTLPPEMQEEYSARLADFRQRVVGNALTYQYAAQDSFYANGINQEYEKARTGLDPRTGGDPAQLERWKTRMNELVDSSGLPEAKKFEEKQRIAIGLEGVVYRNEAKQTAAAGGGSHRIRPEIGAIIDTAANKYGIDPNAARAIAWLESRGDPTKQNPKSSAGGLFQQTDGNASDYGVGNRFDAAQSAEGAMKFAAQNKRIFMKAFGREPSAGELYLMHQQGPGGAMRLLQNPNALAVDVVGYDEVRLNGGAPGMTAGQFANLWINKGNKVAGDVLDSDERFANLPYEDRIALRQDAEREAVTEGNEREKQLKADYNSRYNALMTSILDGKGGQADIDSARQDWLSDYSDIARAQALLKEQTKAAQLLAAANVKLGSEGSIWDPTSDDDKKMLNAKFKDGGEAAFTAGDQDYVTNELLPIVARSRDIPTNAMGMLEGMMRSTDPRRMLYAYNTLAALQDIDPAAFDKRATDDMAKKVSYWRDRKGSVPEDELVAALQGGRNQTERQLRLTLRSEAQDILNTKEKGVTELRRMSRDFYKEWGPDPVPSSMAFAAAGLERDLRVAFIDAYELWGDAEKASQEAAKMVQRTWGSTSIGGQRTMMKFPPEKLYPEVLGGHEWIDRQARQELGFENNEQFQLLSDAQTEDEYLTRNQTGEMPSYQVIRYDADGAPHLVMDEDGNARRIFFRPTEEDKAEELRQYELRRAENELSEFLNNNNASSLLSILPGESLDAELKEERNRLIDNVRKLRGETGDKPEDRERALDQFLNGNPLGGM